MNHLNLYRISGACVIALALVAPHQSYHAEEKDQYNTPSLTSLHTPNEAQKKQIRSFIEQIAEVEKAIATMHDDLEIMKRVKDNQTVMYMAAEYMGLPGNQGEYRYFINERATIFWNGNQPEKFELFRRQARIRGIYIIRKTMTARTMIPVSETDTLDVPIQILIEETLESGKGEQTQFRLPGPNEAVVSDHTELISTTTNKNKEVRIIYLRKVEDRLEVLRDYLQFLRDIERRIRYLINSKLDDDSDRYQRTNTITE